MKKIYLLIALSFAALLFTPNKASAIDSKWCCTVWVTAGSGNFALKGGSASSADLRVVGKFNTSQQAKNAAQAYVNNGYALIGPCRCDKAWEFHRWISQRGNDYTSHQDLVKWNRDYNIKHYGTANP